MTPHYDARHYMFKVLAPCRRHFIFHGAAARRDAARRQLQSPFHHRMSYLMDALKANVIGTMNRMLLIALVFASASHAQWTVHQLPTNNRCTGIYFADSLNGWICGHDGILRTTNGGDDWFLQRSGVVNHMTGFNTHECWATGLRDTLLHTTNEGNDWIPVLLGDALDSSNTIGRICFVDSMHGWVVANRDGSLGNWILRTTDAGRTWSAFPGNLMSADMLCTFVDTLTGWAAGRESEIVVRTTDAGVSWATISYVYRAVTDIQFLTRDIGWVCTDSPVIATETRGSTDGGSSWTRGLRFECSRLTTYASFVDTLRGWVAQYNCLTGLEIVHTSDGGVTWTSQFAYYPQFLWSPTRIFFVDGSHGWVIGDGDMGLIFRTKTGGLTSAKLEPEEALVDFTLCQNYPNPFNPETRIHFELPQDNAVRLVVYDLLGRQVMTLVNEFKKAGRYDVVLDAATLASGVYFYRLQTGAFNDVKKLLVLR